MLRAETKDTGHSCDTGRMLTASYILTVLRLEPSENAVNPILSA